MDETDVLGSLLASLPFCFSSPLFFLWCPKLDKRVSYAFDFYSAFSYFSTKEEAHLTLRDKGI